MEQQTDKDDKLCKDIQMSLRGSPMWSSMVSTVEAEVMKLLENKNKINETKNHIQPPETTELINKLIFEYMNWMGYKLTSTMFTKESGTEFMIKNDREQISQSLDLVDNNESLCLPLLTVLIIMFKNKNMDKEDLYE